MLSQSLSINLLATQASVCITQVMVNNLNMKDIETIISFPQAYGLNIGWNTKSNMAYASNIG